MDVLGAVPQTLRGMPGNFGGQPQQQQQQQQPPQAGRPVSNRLPNGKLGMRGPPPLPTTLLCADTHRTANANSGWAFSGAVPMGAAGLQNPGRQLSGNISFAQSLSGSQSAAPLDLSYVPLCLRPTLLAASSTTADHVRHEHKP